MPQRDGENRFCGTLNRLEVDGKWDRNYFVLDEDKFLLRYFSMANAEEEVVDWDDFEGEIDIGLITKIEDKTETKGYFEIQTSKQRLNVRADTSEGTEQWVRTLRKAAVNPTKRQEVPEEKPKPPSEPPSENGKEDSGSNLQPERISYKTSIIGGVVVRTPVRKTSVENLSGDSRVRTGSGGPTSTLKIIKEGYLVKKGAVVKNWKRRFFRLDFSKLAYYEKESDKDPLKVISTANITSIRESLGVDSNRDHVFEVATAARTFLIQAETKEEMNSWLDAIGSASVHRGRSASGPEANKSVRPLSENYAATTTL